MTQTTVAGMRLVFGGPGLANCFMWDMTTGAVIKRERYFSVANAACLPFDDGGHCQVIGAGQRHEYLDVATVAGHPRRVGLVREVGASDHSGLGLHHDVHVERRRFRRVRLDTAAGIYLALFESSDPIDEAEPVGG